MAPIAISHCSVMLPWSTSLAGVIVISGIVLRDLSRGTTAQCWEVRFGAGAATAPETAEHFGKFA